MICRLLLVVCLFTTSCAQRAALDTSTLKVPGPREIKEAVITEHVLLSEAEKASCLARGGYVDLVTFSTEGCVIRTKDAGKACDDSIDCEGACLATLDLAEGTRATGTCASEIGMLFGCRNIISNGQATGQISH